MMYRHRCYWSVLRLSRAYKHWTSKPEYQTPFEYHLDKQKVILGKKFKNDRVKKYVDFCRREEEHTGEIGVSAYATLYVLSTGCQGMGRSVLLQTNTERYLFNCGEGTQKYIYDVVDNLETIDNVFFTYNCWDNVGGLIGFFLTNSHNINRNKQTLLHGPPNVSDTLSMIKQFSDSFKQAPAQYEWRGIEHKTFKDEQVIVDYVALRSNQSCDTRHQSSDLSGAHNSYNKDKNHDRVLAVKNEKMVMAYIIKMKDTQLNNPSFPSLKDDLEVHAVRENEGNKKQSADDQHETGPIIVLDCPSFDYMDSLLTSEHFMDFERKYSQPPHMIVHMAPIEVVQDKRYKEFMARFNDDTVHLMLNEKCYGPIVHRSQEVGLMYHKLHPQIFPLLHGLHKLSNLDEVQTGNVVQGVYSLPYTFRAGSHSGFQWEEVINVNLELGLERAKYEAKRVAFNIVKKSDDKAVIEKWSKFDESMIDEELTNLKCTLAEVDTAEDLSEEYPEVTFLGTGSFIPKYHRNGSCILVQMRKDEYIMLDCGEGSLIQMYQMFGQDKTEHILCNLKAVFLSHLHFDHHGGLFGILEARNRIIRRKGEVDPLKVLTYSVIRKWFQLYSNRVLGQEAAVSLLFNNQLFEAIKCGDKFDPDLQLVKNELNLVELVCVPVNHTPASYGLVIKHKDGWKLTYSGDCMPTPALIRYGQDSDILIHEGTFHDTFSDFAKKKRHSTTSQAIDVAEEMNARFTILTHFSLRTRIPCFTERFTENIGVSFDFMQVRPSQLKLLPLFKPVLEAIYGSHTTFVLMKFTDFSGKFAAKYGDVIKEIAVNEHLSHQIRAKQRQDHHRKLWLENSRQFKRNLLLSEQSKTGKCFEESYEEMMHVSDVNGNDNSNTCDTNSTNTSVKIKYSSEKKFIDDSLLKKLRKND